MNIYENNSSGRTNFSKKGNNFFLILSIIFFFLYNFSLMVHNVLVADMPRTGDDALVYILKSQNFKNGYDESNESLKSLKKQYHSFKPEISDEGGVILNERMLMRISGSIHPLSDVIISAISIAKKNLTEVFLIYESIVLVIFAIGITTLLKSIFSNSYVLALSVIILSYIYFPERGFLLYYSPSLLCFSVSFILWGYIIKNEDIRPYKLFIFSLIISSAHTIGLILILIATILLLLVKNTLKLREIVSLKYFKESVFANKKNLISLIAGYSLYKLISLIFIPQIPADMHHTGYISFSEGFFENLKALADHLINFSEYNLLLIVIALFGFYKYPKDNVSIKVTKILIILFLALFAALFHYLEGNHAELALRISTPIIVILITYSIYVIFKIENKTLLSILVFLLVTTQIYQVKSSYKSKYYFPSLKNDLNHYYDEQKIKEFYESINPKSKIIHFNIDYGIIYNLIFGDKENSLLYIMPIANQSGIEEYINEFSADYIIIPYSYLFGKIDKKEVDRGYRNSICCSEKVELTKLIDRQNSLFSPIKFDLVKYIKENYKLLSTNTGFFIYQKTSDSN